LKGEVITMKPYDRLGCYDIYNPLYRATLVANQTHLRCGPQEYRSAGTGSCGKWIPDPGMPGSPGFAVPHCLSSSLSRANRLKHGTACRLIESFPESRVLGDEQFQEYPESLLTFLPFLFESSSTTLHIYMCLVDKLTLSS
jgi:hypothetical protein